MNFTGIDFATLMPDNSLAYIAFDLEHGFRLLEERRDLNAVYFRDLEDTDTDGISNTAVTTQGLIIKSSLVAYNGSLGPLEDRVGELIKIGDTWATVLLYNSDRSVVVDNYPLKLPPIQSIQNNLINIPLHGLVNNEPIQFSGGTPPIGITEGTTYYVRNPTTNSFNISAASGGSNIALVDRAGELHVSKLYSVFVPTLNYDVIKDTIIGKVIRTGNVYTVETFYNVSGESITSFEIVEALPAFGDYEGQVILFQNTFYTWNGVSWATASGESSRTVSLSVTQQAFDYTSNGNLIGTPTSTVTATAFGTSGTLTYVFKVDGTVLSGTGNTRTYTPNSTEAAMPDIVTVDLFEDGLLVASDLITMFGVTAGGDAVTIILSNEAHTIPTDSAGNNGVFTGSGTTIKVFRGNTALNYVSGGTTSSFDVSFTSTQVGGGAITGSGTATATIGDITSISANTGRRDITVTVYFDGVTSTFSKVQSFSRSLAGVAGTNGTNGTNGPRGAGRWHIDVDAVDYVSGTDGRLPLDSTDAQEAWNEGTFASTSPGTQVAGDQAWFYKGTIGNPTSQSVWIYNGTSWAQQTEVIDGNLLVTDTITADKLNVNTLSAITADLGTVTAGTIRGGTVLGITSLTAGITYIIESVGTGSNWTSIGASSATVGTVFVKNSTAGTGTGTALTAERTVITSSVVEVFDSANVRRVRLGIWT